MSILVGEHTHIIIQGMTGKMGRVHAKRTLEAGTNLLAGVTPGRGGEYVWDIPIYDHVSEAVQEHPQINATMILTPPPAVLGAAMEAIEAGIKLIVIITEFVPVHDSLKIVKRAESLGAVVVGPNTIGVISPGMSKIGVMPDYIYKKGHIGIVSRSGTLTHEVASNLTFAGFGQSSCLCIGGDAIGGLNHTKGLEFFKEDEDTAAVILIGEIGGTSEEDAADYIRETGYQKPVFAYIAGVQAPVGKKMGHAGAIVSKGKGTADSKIRKLQQAGVKVAETTGRLLQLIREEDERQQHYLRTVEAICDID